MKVLDLERDAANALMRWRRSWEREHGSEPTEGCGFKRELPLWKIAGKLIRQRGGKTRLPG